MLKQWIKSGVGSICAVWCCGHPNAWLAVRIGMFHASHLEHHLEHVRRVEVSQIGLLPRATASQQFLVGSAKWNL